MGIKEKSEIVIRGARQHNLKNIDIKIPRDKFVVITGLSGSGKSSLAFDTIYAEGQRRYVESLSSYARQFIGLMEKPEIDSIEGLSPAISIEQKATARNPRSTVGTVTEIHDYLRLLFAHIGKPHCWECGKLVEKQTVQQIVDSILKLKSGTKIHILSPLVRGRKGGHANIINQVRKEGFIRIRLNNKILPIDEIPKINKNKKNSIDVVIDRLKVDQKFRDRITESVELALKIGNGLLLINVISGREYIFSENLSCPECQVSYEEILPRMFSFNSPYGACPACDGLGSTMEVDPNIIVPDKSKSLLQGAIAPLGDQPRDNWYGSVLRSLARYYDFNFTTPWINLSPSVRRVLLFGSGDDKIKMEYRSRKWTGTYSGGWEGAVNNLMRRYTQTKSLGVRKWIEQFMSMRPCNSCNGTRLKEQTLAVKIDEVDIGQISSKSVKELKIFFDTLELSKIETQISNQILKEISQRLEFLINVGLDYLTLDRSAITLSGGEAQRIRLATQIGSQLMGVLYVLDEPSIGLHPRDNKRLLKTLKKLRDIGNSILVVEHDKETIEASDFVVDLGPRAGKEGGEVTYAGHPNTIHEAENSITGEYMSGAKKIEVPKRRRQKNNQKIVLEGAKGNNLKSINVTFPLGCFVAITGVSGSGKSTLINETLYPLLSKELNKSQSYSLNYDSISGTEFLDKVVEINQKPIGRTPRSNPATYTGVFTFIRDLFSKIEESKVRGYKPGRFSFNVKGGRCESCTGDGIIKIEMNFLPDVYVKCEVCSGARYNRETLEVLYKGKSIAQILEMSIIEALTFFRSIPSIYKKLKTLNEVGLGYIQLGQQATTLSGGEAQRVKLATELSKVSTSKTLYILDEPTTGLHFEDIWMLLKVLQKLVERGNTVIVIEHNLDIIKSSDWVIDLGPEGGEGGGKIIAEGSPEVIANVKNSYTGHYLKEVLEHNK